jgi:hypothetical protein
MRQEKKCINVMIEIFRIFLRQDLVNVIEDTSHFLEARLARDRVVDLAVDRPHLVGALVSLHGLQEPVGRGGKVLDHHKAPDPLLLLSLRRCRHEPPALLEGSNLDLLGDESDNNRRRRLALRRLLLREDTVAGLDGVVDLWDRAQVASRLGRRQERLENPVVHPSCKRSVVVGGNWEVEDTDLSASELLLPNVECILDTSQLRTRLLLVGLKI